jgi:hypothetical protein
MSHHPHDHDERIEDLDVQPEESAQVKGGVAVGDVNGDGLDLAAGPDRPTGKVSKVEAISIKQK